MSKPSESEPLQGASLLAEVADYYASRLAEHGETARGVDWNGEESQSLRFAQLCRVVDATGPFSINDLGCGYGALYERLAASPKPFDYAGYDIAPDMVKAAERRLAGRANARFAVAGAPDRIADFGVASGILNVRLGRTDDEWWSHLVATLDSLDRTSRLGFAFNCLTSYSDPGRMRNYLYYADPCAVFDLCKRRYARDVALLHDYGLYEFTMLVRKSP